MYLIPGTFIPGIDLLHHSGTGRWVICQQNEDVVVVVTYVTGMRTYSSRLI